MFNPVEISLKIQQVAIEGAAASARMMTTNYLRFIEQQSHLLQNTMSNRRDEGNSTPPKKARHESSPVHSARKKTRKGKKSPCSGPDLLDHYGKRAHDVDVEHI